MWADAPKCDPPGYIVSDGSPKDPETRQGFAGGMVEVTEWAAPPVGGLSAGRRAQGQTPVEGFYLIGQDVVSQGIQDAA